MPSQNLPLVDRVTAIETLNALMRGELIAAETYRRASAHLGVESPGELTTCLQSHDQRATLIAEYIVLAGGTPVSGNGVWEAFAHLMQRDGTPIGARSVCSVLLEGEDLGLTAYRAALGQVDQQGLILLRQDLLPEQVRTHGLMSHRSRQLV
jgi:hypothetical protein